MTVSDRTRTAAAWSAVALVTGITAISRSGGLAPASLWFDDLWVASLARFPHLREALAMPAPVPPGLLAGMWALAHAAGAVEWPLQMLPFVSGLVVIPLFARLAHRITGSLSLAAAGAAAIALSPQIARYSIHVKPFSVDAAATVLLLLLATRALERPSSPGARWALVGGAVGLLAVSFFSAIVAAACLATVALQSMARRERHVASWLPIGAAVAGLGVVYLTWIQPRSGSLLAAYWTEDLLLKSPRSAFGFLLIHGERALAGAFPAGTAALLLLAAVGVGSTFQNDRRLGALLAFAAAAAVAASAAGFYPMGAGRTDAFLHPVVMLAAILGVQAVTRAWLPGRMYAAVLLVSIACAWPARVHYPDDDGATIVAALVRAARPADGLLVAPGQNWLVACYGPWPYSLEPTRTWATGFVTRTRRPRSLSLGRLATFGPAPEAQAFLRTAPRRLHFLSPGGRNRPEARSIRRLLTLVGYRCRSHLVGHAASLEMCVRSAGRDEPGAGGE